MIDDKALPQLEDGRSYITDEMIVECPYLRDFIHRCSNFWEYRASMRAYIGQKFTQSKDGGEMSKYRVVEFEDGSFAVQENHPLITLFHTVDWWRDVFGLCRFKSENEAWAWVEKERKRETVKRICKE